MPSRAGRRCPRCRRRYTGPRCLTCKGRDETYRAEHDDGDGFYQTPEWLRISRAFLKEHPWCVLCAQDGLTTKAVVSDHYPESRKQLVQRGVQYPDSWRRLRPLCMGHHRSETNRLQPGGFIRHPERY